MRNKYDSLMKELNFRYIRGGQHVPTSEEEIAKLESSIGNALPPDYREFLLKYGLTGSSVGRFMVQDAVVEVFYGLGPNANSYDLSNYAKGSNEGYPAHFFPIASSAGGQIGLFLGGKNAGQVYWFNTSGPADDPMDDTELLAKDFDGFMRKIHVVDDDD